jgi:DNA processing protein
MEELYFHCINQIFKPYQLQIFKLYHKLGNFKKLYETLKLKHNLENIDLEKEEKNFKKTGIEIIIYGSDNYPSQLKNIDTPPLGFYILGNKNLLKDNNKLLIAIVGTRKSSSYGNKIAYQFSQQLSNLGIITVSGLAYGIDTYVHQGAVDIHKETIGILGEGIITALKTAKKNLIEKILENNGLIISEFSPLTPGLPYHFPLRNRIIAGLSEGVIIVEDPLNSGALITAHYAFKYNKEIFVVPSNITYKSFEGSHNLIKQGARLITNIEDIINEFNLNYQLKNKVKNIKLSPKEEIVYEILKIQEKTIEELSQETQLSIQELLIILTDLEIKEVVKNKGGKFYVI